MDLPPPRFRYMTETDYVSLKNHVNDLVNRAYFNLHGTAFSNNDSEWQATIFKAALDATMDTKARGMSDKQMMHIFEDIIRISEELFLQSQECLSKATSSVYLRTMALDQQRQDQQQIDMLVPNQPSRRVGSLALQRTVSHPRRSDDPLVLAS